MKIALPMMTLLAATAIAGSASATNIVTNPGFETGTLAGWTANGASSDPWGVTSSGPVEGTYAASTGCVGAQCTDQTNLSTASYLYQDLNTAIGADYTLTFDFTPDAGTPNELKVLWGGGVVDDLVNVAYSPTLVSYTVAGLTASNLTTRLTFLGRQDPGFDRLDNVSVTETGTGPGAVPEPATWAMMLLGFGVTGTAVRRRSRLVAPVSCAG